MGFILVFWRSKTTILLLALLSISTLALAELAVVDFEITKSTVDGGGGTSSGGEFSLTGTIGQADASRSMSFGGQYLLAGGFWAKAVDLIFKNGFESEGGI